MAKKSIASSVRGLRVKKSVKYVPDNQIDFSDIPEITHEQIKNGFRPGRPLIKPSSGMTIAVRLEPKILKKLKSYADKKGKGYQALVNEILVKFFKKGIV